MVNQRSALIHVTVGTCERQGLHVTPSAQDAPAGYWGLSPLWGVGSCGASHADGT